MTFVQYSLLLLKPIRGIFTFLFISIFSCALCQEQTLQFKHLTTEDGLSPSNVRAICQDKLGFVWIGTYDGLNRYDGKNIVVYEHNPDNANSLLSNQVRSIFEDSKGNLWVGTSCGLNLFDRNNNQFIHKDEWPKKSINCFFEDKDHVLWIGENYYFHSIDLNTNICKSYSATDTNDTQPGSRNVYGIMQDSWQNIWVGTANGIFVLDKKNKKIHNYYPNKNDPNGLSGISSSCLWQDKLKRIWIGTQQGVSIITNPNPLPDRLKCQHIQRDGLPGMEHGEVHYFFVDKNDNLYLSTVNDGLFVLKNSSNPQNLQFPLKLVSYKYDPESKFGINSKGLNMVMQDNQNTIWIATYTGGANYFNPQASKFELISKGKNIDHSIIDNQINTFLDETEYLWIGTESGLSRYNKKTKRYTHFRYDPKNIHSIGSDAVSIIYRDKQNQLWIGCWNGGLNLFNEKTQSFQVYKHDEKNLASISNNNVFSIFEDSKNRFWIGTVGGYLNLFDRRNKTFSFPRKEEAYYEQIIENYDGMLWMVNAGSLDLYSPLNNEIKKYIPNPKVKGSLSSNLIYTVFIDSKRNLWVGTDNGLNLYLPDKDKFRYFQMKDGLPDNAVRSITEDKQGNLWLGTYKGISKFKDAINLPAKIVFRNYTKEDGLQSDNFRKRSAIIGIDSRLYFGGNHGFNIINPDSLRDNTFIPPIVFTGLAVLYKPVVLGKKDCPVTEDISMAKKIELKHWQSEFTIKFAALNFISAEKNQYAYKLEGFDKDWNYVGPKNEATYTSLAPGKYVFKVIASNNDGYWNKKGIEIAVIVNPPWWKSIWAKLVYLIIASISIVLIWNRTVLMIKLRNNLEIEHIKAEEAKEFARMKSEFFINVSHELSTPLTLIMAPIEKMINKQYFDPHLMGMAKKNSETLLRLVNEFIECEKIEEGKESLNLITTDIILYLTNLVDNFQTLATNKNILLQLQNEIPSFSLEIDIAKFEKIIYNLLSNAIKYTPELGKVTLSTAVIHEKNIFFIKITDTGIGISKENINYLFDKYFRVRNKDNNEILSKSTGFGIGLYVTKHLIELHGGTLDVESEPGQGSCFSIKLPFTETDKLLGEAFTTEKLDITLANETSPNQTEKLNKILIVEDNAEVCELLNALLRNEYLIYIASDGKEGIKLAEKYLPSLIITDIMMPQMNGIEFCKKIKQNFYTSHIPVIMLTALNSSKYMIKGLETGADDYISKPFNPAILEVKVRNIIELRKHLQKQFIAEIKTRPSQPELVNPDDVFLAKVVQIIEDNIDSVELDVSKLAEGLNITSITLYRKLKTLTGQSINQFIRSVRLKRAANILESKKYSIQDVALMVGFNDLKYFRKCFHKQFGSNPSEYDEINDGRFF
jgi:signal transduction histidine kinase/ligand-binding sensor domain-containing protein/DNA-binding response OmpR family regulator